MSERPSLLLVNPGPLRKRPLLEAVLALPLDLFVLSAPEERWVEALIAADRLNFCDITDEATVLDAAQAFGVTFDGLGTYYEPSVLSAAYAAEQLGLPGPGVAAARQSSISKADMRAALAAGGIATPRFESFMHLGALPDLADRIGYPCVLKPASGADSQSVRKIHSREEAEACVDDRTALEGFRGGPFWVRHDPRWVVEQYLDGPLLAVDGYAVGGQVQHIGTAETELSPEPYFNIEVNWIPPRLPTAEVAAAQAETERIIAALGVDTAAFHAEFRMTAEGPRLIEIATRLAGGVMPQGYQQSLGIDLAEVLAALWLGQPVPTAPRKAPLHVLQKGVFPRDGGILSEVTGMKAAQALPGVFEFLQVSEVGAPLVVYPDASIPVYYYGIAADTHAALLNLRDRLEAAISWTTRPAV